MAIPLSLSVDWDPTDIPPPLLLIAMYSFRVFAFGPVMFFIGRMLKGAMSNSALKQVLNDSKRKPIVYLRSFAMDKQLNRIKWHEYLNPALLFVQTPEQKLVAQMLRTGPVVAIGKPNESLPELGACLLYTSPSPRDATLSRMPSSS